MPSAHDDKRDVKLISTELNYASSSIDPDQLSIDLVVVSAFNNQNLDLFGKYFVRASEFANCNSKTIWLAREMFRVLRTWIPGQIHYSRPDLPKLF